MITNLDTNQRISALHEKAKELILEKKEEADVISELAKEGIDTNYAQLIIENVKTDLSNKKEFRKELLKGISVTLFGLLLNVSSFIAFSNTGSYVWIVFWGIVVFGITLIIRAFIIFKK